MKTKHALRQTAEKFCINKGWNNNNNKLKNIDVKLKESNPSEEC